jgi:thiol-disulfide isomerase/thioredoxin
VRLSVIVLILVVILSGCREESHRGPSHLKPGDWLMEFSISDSSVLIPVRMEVDSAGHVFVKNNSEVIALDSVSTKGDSISFKFPYFQTFLSAKVIADSLITGNFTDPTRAADYAIPFTAKWISATPHSKGKLVKREIYDASFSKGDTMAFHKAIGVFDLWENGVSGTFLTETGDYRFLSGRVEKDLIWLSCLDGSHLFYFKGNIKGDSITAGRFYSGNHWQEPWDAVASQDAKLRDPDSLTFVLPDSGPFQFTVTDHNGKAVAFNNDSFRQKVTVVQIFGSWCPNCSDEGLFLKELHRNYSSKGLQIIPVAFERSDNMEENARVIGSQAKEMALDYPVFLGGQKRQAGEVFPMLNKIMSFPTTIFLDKKGEVRKIHTGFYGPGTGDYYTHYTDRIELFVSQLLDEK